MRKPRDFDAELKALGDKARELKNRKVQQFGELVIATGADSLGADELAGALIVLAETKDTGKREAWVKRGATFCPQRWRHSGATGIKPQGRGMTCARGKSSAASTLSNSVASSSKPESLI